MFSFFTLIVGICVMFLSNVEHLDIYVIGTIILFSIAFIFDIIHQKRIKPFATPIVIGYAFRIFLLFYDVYSTDPLHLPLVGGELISDPLGFYNAAVRYSKGYAISYGGFFSKFLGRVFSVTGPSRLLGEFIVLLFSIGTIIIVAIILDEQDVSYSDKLRGTYLICLLPNYAFLSVVLRRETIITFFVALSILHFTRWFRGTFGEKSFILAIAYALLASLFHGATGMIIATYLLVRILYSPKKQFFVFDPQNIIGALFFLVVVMVVYSRFGATFFNKIESRISSGSFSVVRDAGGASYARYVGDARTPFRMLIYTLPRFLYYMFSPFPWQWRGAGDILAFAMSSCVYLLIIVDALRYIRLTEKENNNRKLLIALLLIALLIASIFSWGVTNTGTATRHRDKFIALYTVIYVLSADKRLRLKGEGKRRGSKV